MAAPTSGPYGTTATIYDPAGVDADPVGAPWTQDITTGVTHDKFRRVSNQLAATAVGTNNQSANVTATYGIECEFWMEIPAKAATNGHYFDIWALVADPDTPTIDGYFLEVAVAAGADTWDFGKFLNDVPDFPITSGSGAASATQELAAGDYVGFSLRTGGVLKAWYWAIAGSSWSNVMTYTDTTITADGYMGLEATLNSAWRFGKIYGGAISGAAVLPPFPLLGRGASW